MYTGLSKENQYKMQKIQAEVEKDILNLKETDPNWFYEIAATRSRQGLRTKGAETKLEIMSDKVSNFIQSIFNSIIKSKAH